MLSRVEIGLRGFRHKIYRSRGGFWIPLFDTFINKHRNIIAVLGTSLGKTLIPASNIVTDAGDIYYAQLGAAEATTNAFGILELASAGDSSVPSKENSREDITVIGSTQKAHDGSYPRTNDPDGDNTGAGADVVSFLTSYTKGDFNAGTIHNGIITNVTPGATEPVLTSFEFAADFGKTADDTLKVFTNHNMNGV